MVIQINTFMYKVTHYDRQCFHMSNNPVAVIAAFTALSCTHFHTLLETFFNARYESNANRAVSKRNWMTNAVTDVLQDGFIWQKSKLVAYRFIYSGAASSVTRSAMSSRISFFLSLFRCTSVSRRNFPAVSRLSSMSIGIHMDFVLQAYCLLDKLSSGVWWRIGRSRSYLSFIFPTNSTRSRFYGDNAQQTYGG